MKKKLFFHKEGFIVFVILISFVLVIFKLIDISMPEYRLWQTYNNTLLEDRNDRNYYIEKGYPKLEVKNTSLSKNSKNILIIGDSYISGSGTSNINNTWWRKLELELYNRGYYNVNVKAVGISGASTQDELEWLKNTSLIDDYKPDIVILGYVSNDIELSDSSGNLLVKKIKQVDYFEKNKILKFLKSCYPSLSYKINNMLNNNSDKEYKMSEYNEKTGYPDALHDKIISSGNYVKLYENEVVKPFCEYLNSLDIPSFIVNTPNNVSSKEDKENIYDLFRKNGVKVYNMFDSFKEYQKNVKDYKRISLVNSHPGPAYTKFYAEYVADILEDSYTDIIGKKSEEKIEYPLNINWSFPNIKYKIDDLKDNTKIINFNYPYKNLLYMPIKEEYMQLNLEYPVALKSVNLQGNDLKSAKIYVTTVDNKLGFDTQELKFVGEATGQNLYFNINEDELITSICISADIGAKSNLSVIIKK